jgi:SAM-dependent methyltransferase
MRFGMVPWHEDDTFWEDISPFLFTDVRCGEEAGREVEQVIALSSVPPDAKILDIGCGPGRHAMEFARRGFSVTGVDRTAAFLERAIRQADEEQLLVEFVLADMRTFHRPLCFDVAISLYTTFGYFESEEDESAVLRNLFASLKPGGRLVMELLGKELIARDFRARNWQCSPDGTAFLLEEREVRGGWGFLQNHWLLLSNTTKEYRWTMRLYSGAELESLLRNTGFSSVTLYGGLTGSPYNNEAKRLIAVSQK